jgi:predicted nucleic acid-binding protein
MFNKFLELALSGDADCIVSGDRDLLVLNPFRGIPIIAPRDFLESSWE